MTQFAIEPKCAGVRVMRWDMSSDDPPAKDWATEPFVMLAIDFEPGAAEQRWWLWSGEEGKGSEHEIAAHICDIARGVGAKIVR
jgi:hypothetical protein